MNSLDGRIGPRHQSATRNIARSMKQAGKTYAEIGVRLGVSRQRAQQLVSPTSKRLREIRNALGNKCQACGRRRIKLETHHSDYSLEPDKLLCPSCHRMYHNYSIKEVAEMQPGNKLNKTKRLEIPVTPALFQSVKDCATKLGVKHTEWARSALANAAMVQCLQQEQREQEQKQ